MRKSCVQALCNTVHSLSVSTKLMRRDYVGPKIRVYKQATYTRFSAQLSGSVLGTCEQLLSHINRLAGTIVHIIHTPYSNYNYLNI